jgi:hypothetical protein
MSRDAQITDITITLKKAFEDRLHDALEMLKAAGLDVSNADDDTSVIEGSVEISRLTIVEGLECVEYVRRVMTYNVDYPAGDPRDRNGCIDGACDDTPPQINRKMGKSYP